ncbi:hypothetical protein [Sulfurovum mangrovi]|uniref:hypothetical protein n=1 Tax=Sulfurovum mangrovi TaxID=2893889 RepID=UPI001E58E4F8|nr:hypothetical protein [Sulfurovum mangrovi]UFH59189.1 hypothetical protein LN246_12730 [Sulfurovum mangrovi]
MFKKIVVTSMVGLAMLAFSGCTDGKDTATGKCDSAKEVKTKCGEGKCDSAKKTVTKEEGKCGSE